jgi:hypothetical protein
LIATNRVTGRLAVTNSILSGSITVEGDGVLSAHNVTIGGLSMASSVVVRNGGTLNLTGTGSSVFWQSPSASTPQYLSVERDGTANLAGRLALYGPLTNAGTLNLSHDIEVFHNERGNRFGGLVNAAEGTLNLLNAAGITSADDQAYFINQGKILSSNEGSGTWNTIALSRFTNAATITVLHGVLK